MLEGMDTAKVISQLWVSYRSLVCDNQFDVLSNMETYSAKLHKGVQCRPCGTLHVVFTDNWLSFLREVGDSGLVNRDKNLFVHAGVLSGTVRKHYAEDIEVSAYWVHMEPFFTAQQEELAAFTQETCENSKDVRKSNPDSVLSTIICDACGKRHYVVSDMVKVFAKNIEFKNRLGATSKTVPHLVYAHAETKLDSVAHTFMKNLKVQLVDETLPAIKELLDYIHAHEVDVLTNLDSFLPRLHTALWCVKCSKSHVIAKQNWVFVANRLEKKTNLRVPLFERMKFMTVQAHCTQLAKNNPEFATILNGFNAPDGKFLSANYLDYILPVQYVSDNLLIEYYVCGRKNRYLSASDAQEGMLVHKLDSGNSVYSCGYCSGYHYGHKPQRAHTVAENAQKGTLAYVYDVKKANRFIHNLMTS